MNIKDKLARLDKTAAEKKPAEVEPPISDQWVAEFQRELDAKIISEGNSFIILKENTYPIYSHQDFQDVQENGFVLPNLHHLTADDNHRNLNLRECAFIDLETTGLAGGTGTYAFLVGLGHIELDHIVVRQYLLPDFQHEWLLLKQVENSLLSFANLVSFNGKSYDIPLLRTRFVLNRMDSLLDEMPHVDILHPARRLWKRRLSACDLQNLEYAILGQERINDIPGEMIPQIYFEYIRKREAILLRDVLEHNYHDIVNMILLTIEIGRIASEPLRKLTHPEDQFSLARFYFQHRRFNDAIPLLEEVIRTQPNTLIGKEALFLLSLIYKKMGDHPRAGELMRQLLQQQRDHPHAIEELAKYYEHREKNYPAALELVEQGIEYIELLEQLGKESPLLGIKDSLLYRRNRLLRKLKGKAFE